MKAVALLFAYSALMGGASIIGTVTCQGVTTTASNTAECGGTSNTGSFASASASASTLLLGSAFRIRGEADSNTSAATGTATSSSDVKMSDTFQLLGSGPGFMLIQGNGIFAQSGGGSGFAKVLFSIGPYSDSCASNPANFVCSNQSIIVPIELDGGVDFSMQLDASSGSFAGSGGNAKAEFDATFSFFGPDGKTPAQVVDTPEPATLATTAVGLCLLAATIALQRNRKPAPSGQ